MKPFQSVAELIKCLAMSGFSGHLSVITDWNPEGKRVFVCKRSKPTCGRTNCMWLIQRGGALTLHERYTLEVAQ